MTTTACERDESGLLIVSVEIDGKYQLKMVLDTGATHTTLDANALYLLGYELKDSLGTVQIETANGIVETEVFGLHQLAALGLTKTDFVVQVRLSGPRHFLRLQRPAGARFSRRHYVLHQHHRQPHLGTLECPACCNGDPFPAGLRAESEHRWIGDSGHPRSQ